MVPRARFELAIFAVRGRRPEPLDQRGFQLAAEEGFEPSRTDPESAVLPLDDSATYPLKNPCQDSTEASPISRERTNYIQSRGLCQAPYSHWGIFFQKKHTQSRPNGVEYRALWKEELIPT